MPGLTLPDDTRELSSLHRKVAHLEAVARVRGRALAIASAALLALGIAAVLGADLRQQLSSCQAKLVESRQSHSAIARTETERDGARRPVAAWDRGAPAAGATAS